MTALPKSMVISLALSLLAQPMLGDDSIASKYPRDEGIENDPAVVFVEKFDAGPIDAIAKRWESVQHKKILSLSSDVPKGSSGGKSLLMTHVGGEVSPIANPPQDRSLVPSRLAALIWFSQTR